MRGAARPHCAKGRLYRDRQRHNDLFNGLRVKIGGVDIRWPELSILLATGTRHSANECSRLMQRLAVREMIYLDKIITLWNGPAT